MLGHMDGRTTRIDKPVPQRNLRRRLIERQIPAVPQIWLPGGVIVSEMRGPMDGSLTRIQVAR